MRLFNVIQKSKTCALLFLAVVAVLSISPATYAVDVPDFRLQVSPTRNNIGNLEPGQTYEGTFKVQNTGKNDFKYNLTVAPYTVQGQNYDPDYSKNTEYTEITDWIVLSEEKGGVEVNGVDEIKYKIQVPSDAPGGSQSAAILVSLDEENASESTGVQTVRQAAYLIYANISGDTRSTGQVLENKIPSILFAPPVIATSVVENTGNIYTRAEYLLEVKSFFGGKVAYTNADNKDSQTIFPNTERYHEVTWEGAPQIGLFKVKQTIKIFDQVSEVEKIVFICPIWFLIIIIAVIGVVVFWIVSRIFKRRTA